MLAKKIAEVFRSKRRTAQQNETSFFKEKPDHFKIGCIARPALTEFVKTVNEYMKQIDGFTPLSVKDVKLMNIFTNYFEFIQSAFVLPRQYGCIYTATDGSNTDILFTRDDNFVFLPAKHFRIYLKKTATCTVFATCVIGKGGKILATALFEESQNTNGGYVCNAYKKAPKLPAPLSEIKKLF